MADSYPARCKTTTSTVGTASTYVLDTAVLATAHRTPKQAVVDGDLIDGDVVQYLVINSTITGDCSFELGEGVYDDTANTIARTAANVWGGSNGPGVLVSWPGSGTRDVLFLSSPAVQIPRLDRVNVYSLSGTTPSLNADTISAFVNSNTGESAIASIIGNSGQNSQLVFGDETAELRGRILYRHQSATPTSDQMEFYTSNTKRAFLSATGFGVGAEPSTVLSTSISNTSTTPSLEIEQLSTGDAGLMLSIPGDCYSIAIDNSDSDYFKISYSSSAGGAVAGTNDVLTINGANKSVGINQSASAVGGELLQIKSSNTISNPITVIRNGGLNQIFQVTESSGDGLVTVNSSGSLYLAQLRASEDPGLRMSDGTTSFLAGIDITDGHFHIESQASVSFSTPQVTLASNGARFSLNCLFNLLRTSSATDPTTTQYPNDQDVGIHYNTSSTNLFLATNRSGTIYKVQLT